MKPYLSLMRFDNWTKNLLMLAGMALAFLLSDDAAVIVRVFLLSAAALCLASSANYTLNEWLDARFDSVHPFKHKRASVQHALSKWVVLLQYALLFGASMLLAYLANRYVLYVTGAYLFCAWLYNLPPVRLKDVAYVDVLLESVNYPLRILFGWFAVLPTALPPSSTLLLGWSLGAFLMSVKRLAEYQLFPTPEMAAAYRKSYRTYTVPLLACLCLFTAMLSGFSIAVFLVKYRVEFMLAFPFISFWFAWYLLLGLHKNENAIYPERFFKQTAITAFSVFIVIVLIALAKVDIPFLHTFSEPLLF